MPSTTEDRIRIIFEQIARGVNLDRTLALIAGHVAAEVSAPTCKVWVVKRADICQRCPLAHACTNREICMHLVAASGASVEKEYPRIPLSVFNASLISRGGASDFSDPTGAGDKLFGLQHGAAEGGRDSFAVSPLRGPSGILGLIGIFNHRPLDRPDVEMLDRYAPSAVAAIRIAELQARCDALRAQNQKHIASGEAAARSAADRERALQDVGIQLTEQLSRQQAELNRVQTERDAVVLESAEALQRVELLEEENRSLRDRAQELMTLQQESGRAFAEWAAHLESERNRLEETNAALADRNKALEEQSSSIGSAREEFAAQIAERNLAIEGLRTELDVKQVELSEAQEVANRLEERCAALEETGTGLRDHSAGLTETIDDLERSLRIAEDARGRSEQLRVGLASKIADLTLEVEQLRAENARINGESEQLVSEIERIKRELPALRSNCDRLSDENTTLKSTITMLNQVRERTEARVVELENEGSSLAQANTQLEEMVRRYETTSVRLEETAIKHRDRAEASERARAELEQRNRVLVEQNRRLQIESQTKARFLANMSHELRTPMNAIIGFTSLLIEDAALQLSDRHRRNLERVSRNARDLLQLINNVLDLSKIESGRMEVYPEPADVRDLIERAVIVVEPLKQGHSIDLKVEVEEGLPTLKTDRTRLQQVLINLLSNAVKFTERGEVKALAVNAGQGMMRISVIDTGIGIAEQDIPIVFEEFRQLSRNGSGSGLGLTITKRMVELLGGEITVSSRLGEGSTFTVVIPIQIQGKTAPPERVSEDQVSAGRKVLVLDPNPASLYIIKKYLSEAGYGVTATDDPLRALELLKTEKPAVITVSAELQDGGTSTIEHLAREFSGNGAGKIIAITAGGESERRALQAGAVLTLRRPFERSDLLRTIERVTGPERHRVLIVDDDQDALDLIIEMLERAKFDTITARDGKRALEELEKNKPDLVILDLMLPEMDGFEVIDRMTLNPDWKAIPIVLVTARDLSHEERRALDIPMVRIIQKGSFTRDELLADINSILVERRKEDSEPAPSLA